MRSSVGGPANAASSDERRVAASTAFINAATQAGLLEGMQPRDRGAAGRRDLVFEPAGVLTRVTHHFCRPQHGLGRQECGDVAR